MRVRLLLVCTVYMYSFVYSKLLPSFANILFLDEQLEQKCAQIPVKIMQNVKQNLRVLNSVKYKIKE